ncbi:uncharacterized protein LOC143153077 isoform X2 [Ptiloglossa arizonensis]|uniref:uncharacterized protein LOC143153077 isoform X2 n=1 Tax=Ptiloglossa arizonensis TaxID=3350558 RepID=UPI003F9EFEEB
MTKASSRMWMTLVAGLLTVAFVNAKDDAAGHVQSEAESIIPDASLPPGALPGFDGKIPTPKQLLEMLDSMTDISDEEKASIREDLMRNIQADGAQPAAAVNDLTMQTIILLSLLSVVVLIFVFFVYKLFKCLTEREAKRNENKRNKQLKKKK